MTSQWFRRFRPPEAAVQSLVCFPHAGGAASSYRDWQRLLPPSVQVCAVRYPGHQDRLTEPCHRRMAGLADAICTGIEPLLDTEVALFGHSMGASVAFEVARRLENRTEYRIAGLFVSGSPAPHRLRRHDLSRCDDEDLVANAVLLGGCDPAIFADPGLRELLLEPLRADHEILDTYRPDALAPIAAPLVAYVGDIDPEAGTDDLPAWSELTGNAFDYRVFTGGHFYLVEHQTALVSDIAGRLSMSRSTW